MRTICIIPARGGSKRIPRKNIKFFLGKPIIAYSIEAAIESNLFDEVMVSTDDLEIANIAKEYGAKVPFYRNVDTSDDYATTADVIIEVLTEYKSKGYEFDIVCCLYATAPFVSAKKLVDCFNLIHNDIDSAFAVVGYSYPIQRSLIIRNELVNMAYPQYKNSRSQDLDKFYHDAGQFYFSKVKSLEENHSLWGGRIAPFILSEIEVQDLDTMTDWYLAEMKYRFIMKI